MPRVLFVAPIFNYEPILLYSLRTQTHADWELLLIHDGPNSTGLRERLRQLNDSRIRYYETKERYNDWGHTLRAMALEEIGREPIAGELIVITNADNYYCPVFTERMIAAFEEQTIAAYCAMVHSHHQWHVLNSALRHAEVDCGCVMVRREAALAVGWPSREHSADWVCIAELIARYGRERFVKIDNVLFVHN